MNHTYTETERREKVRTLQIRLEDYIPSNFETPFFLKLFNPPDGSEISDYGILMLEKIVRRLDQEDGDIIILA